MGNGEWGMGNGEKILFPLPTAHSRLQTPYLLMINGNFTNSGAPRLPLT